MISIGQAILLSDKSPVEVVERFGGDLEHLLVVALVPMTLPDMDMLAARILQVTMVLPNPAIFFKRWHAIDPVNCEHVLDLPGIKTPMMSLVDVLGRHKETSEELLAESQLVANRYQR